MRYLIEHEIRLSFPEPVKEHQVELRVTPQEDSTQRLHRIKLETDPDTELFSYQDSFGNVVHHFGLTRPHEQFIIRLHADVETLLINPFDYAAIPLAREREWILQSLRDVPRIWDYVLHRSPATPDLSRIDHTDDFPTHDSESPLIFSVQQAMDWVQENFEYDADSTGVHTDLRHMLELKGGTSQDFAHLLVAIVRAWEVPSRYVMGYQDPRYSEEDEDSPQQQAVHAWTEVLIPGAGWQGFDATHGLVANDTYVRVAVGRDHGDALPLRSSFKGTEQVAAPEVSLRVSPQQ